MQHPGEDRGLQDVLHWRAAGAATSACTRVAARCAAAVLTRSQVCSDLGFQQYGHWSLIDSGNPEVGVRCERCLSLHLRRRSVSLISLRVEYGFGPQYSSAVRQSVSMQSSDHLPHLTSRGVQVQYDIYCDCSSGSGYPEVSACPSLAVFPMPTVHTVCKMKWWPCTSRSAAPLQLFVHVLQELVLRLPLQVHRLAAHFPFFVLPFWHR